MTGERYEADRVQGLSRVGRPLLVRYDLDAIRACVSRETIQTRPTDMWRWREMLPVRRTGSIVSLGEIETPLVPIPRSGGTNVLIKDEGRLPTGSFKARGLVMAVSMARELGIERIGMPTNGNAGAALAAYASRCGIETIVLCPEETPEVTSAKSPHRARGCGGSTARSTIAARSSPKAPPRATGSISRR